MARAALSKLLRLARLGVRTRIYEGQGRSARVIYKADESTYASEREHDGVDGSREHGKQANERKESSTDSLDARPEGLCGREGQLQLLNDLE